MILNDFLTKLEQAPEKIEFSEVIALIDALYSFTPTRFTNGSAVNEAGENQGSCKLLAFGQQQKLTQAQMLHCFGTYYREDVLQHPDNTDHQNICCFMQTGWGGIHFDAPAIERKE